MRLHGGRTCCLVVRTSCLIIHVWHVCIPLSKRGVGSTSSKRTLACCIFDTGNAAVFVACLTQGNNLNVVVKFSLAACVIFLGFLCRTYVLFIASPTFALCCPYVTGSRSCWPYVDPLLPRCPSCWRKSTPYAGLCGNNDQIQVLPLYEPMVPHFGLIHVYPIISHAGPSLAFIGQPVRYASVDALSWADLQPGKCSMLADVRDRIVPYVVPIWVNPMLVLYPMLAQVIYRIVSQC